MSFAVKSNRDGTFSVSHSSGKQYTLKSLRIDFPEGKFHGEKGTTYYMAGPGRATIEACDESGKLHTASDIRVEY